MTSWVQEAPVRLAAGSCSRSRVARLDRCLILLAVLGAWPSGSSS